MEKPSSKLLIFLPMLCFFIWMNCFTYQRGCLMKQVRRLARTLITLTSAAADHTRDSALCFKSKTQTLKEKIITVLPVQESPNAPKFQPLATEPLSVRQAATNFSFSNKIKKRHSLVKQKTKQKGRHEWWMNRKGKDHRKSWLERFTA